MAFSHEDERLRESTQSERIDGVKVIVSQGK